MAAQLISDGNFEKHAQRMFTRVYPSPLLTLLVESVSVSQVSQFVLQQRTYRCAPELCDLSRACFG